MGVQVTKEDLHFRFRSPDCFGRVGLNASLGFDEFGWARRFDGYPGFAIGMTQESASQGPEAETQEAKKNKGGADDVLHVSVPPSPVSV